jgi:hypothetical protein
VRDSLVVHVVHMLHRNRARCNSAAVELEREGGVGGGGALHLLHVEANSWDRVDALAQLQLVPG